MLKAVIMDFDGVIIDTEVIWYEVYKDWFHVKKNYELAISEFLVCVGSNYKALFRELEKTKEIYVDEDEFFADTMGMFMDRSNHLPAKEGVIEFIESIKKQNLILLLATSSKRKKPETHLKRLGLINYFDSLITADDVKRIKPFPDLFNLALKTHHVENDAAIVIEDSNNGLIAANKAGIKTIIIPNEVTKYSEFVDYYAKYSSLREVDLVQIKKDFEPKGVK
ncbi:HAD family hydrolase [Virgibacillus oceani]|uniref:Phosphatase n=1 Tax=Virgibacillus oceani TaxID=1479511 RepID=A0A917HEP6_9BACI|nr:HAD family phosphatase [Virgibacillus oceani]GGG76914.1 phosphatase [Virgibacillus oceani]